jgi:hypothetical protein
VDACAGNLGGSPPAHYRGLTVRASEARSVKGLDILIAQLEDEKESLHIVKFKSGAKTAPPR